MMKIEFIKMDFIRLLNVIDSEINLIVLGSYMYMSTCCCESNDCKRKRNTFGKIRL